MELTSLDLSGIEEPRAQALIRELLAIIAEQGAALQAAREEIRQLRDEVNRLKGEQGRPKVKGNRLGPPAPGTSTDHSSERERHIPKPWNKSGKRERLSVTREETLGVERSTLPADARFKGYADVVVQDVELRAEVVCFHKEKWYSPSQQRTYLAPLPAGYAGEYGPGLRALALTLYYSGQMSEPKLLAFFRSAGVQLSEGTLSNLLTQGQAAFHAEKAALYRAGLASSPWQQIDDTSTRVAGQNQVCHIICNPLYTAYFTRPSKDRLSVLDVLRGLTPRQYRVSAEALAYLDVIRMPLWVQDVVATWPQEQDWDEATLAARLEHELPDLGPQQTKWLRDALAVAAYHATVDGPVVRLLVCDAAPQFKGVTEDLALCWVHEGRHYTKLIPYSAEQRDELTAFRGRFWAYYRGLLHYQAQPTAAAAARLWAGFDRLFATQTTYRALAERIAVTRANKPRLLQVLAHPEIPLHNNAAELGARQRVRKRDVSFGPQSEEGREAWDTFMTLVETTKKLGVSIYAYFQDRVRQAGLIPRLDTLIAERAASRNLGASWRLAPSSPLF